MRTDDDDEIVKLRNFVSATTRCLLSMKQYTVITRTGEQTAHGASFGPSLEHAVHNLIMDRAICDGMIEGMLESIQAVVPSKP